METQDRVAVMQQFSRTYRAFTSAFELCVGQPMTRWRILYALHLQGGALSQKQLVERAKIDPGALTRQLKSLEALDWVARATDERDNRVTNVILTALGRDIVAAGLPRRKAFLEETMARLPDDTLNALSQGLALLEARIAEVSVAKADETGAAPAGAQAEVAT